MLQLKVISFITASHRLKAMILMAKLQNMSFILMQPDFTEEATTAD